MKHGTQQSRSLGRAPASNIRDAMYVLTHRILLRCMRRTNSRHSCSVWFKKNQEHNTHTHSNNKEVTRNEEVRNVNRSQLLIHVIKMSSDRRGL